VPAYVVFHDRTLAEIAENQPRDWADLAAISGVGPAKLERYADEVLAVVAPG
jgi:superfamily II DNA helicase RecQ